MTDDRAPLTAQEIDDAKKWLADMVRWGGECLNCGGDSEQAETSLRALGELEALKREMDEACRRLAFTEGQERRASDNNARLRARLEAVEAENAKLREMVGHAKHGLGCYVWHERSCTCGYAAARAALAPGSTQGATDG